MTNNTRIILAAVLVVALAGVGIAYYWPKAAGGNNGNNNGGGNNTGNDTDGLSGGNNGGGNNPSDTDGLTDGETGENNEGGITPVIPTYNPIISVTPASYNAQEDGTLTITGSGFPPNSVAFGLINGTASFSGGIVNPYKTDASGNLNPISRTVPGTQLGQNTLVIKTAATTSQTPVTSVSNTVGFTVWNNQTGDPDNPPEVEPAPTPRGDTGYDTKGGKTFPSVDISGDIVTSQQQVAKAEDNLVSYPSNVVPELNLRTLWNVRRHLYGVLLAQSVGYQTDSYNSRMAEYDRLNPYPTRSDKARGTNTGYKDYYGQPIIVGTPFIDNNGAWAVLIPSDLAPYNWIPAWNLPSGYPTLAAIMASG